MGVALRLNFILATGAIYLIGGNVNERLPNVGSRVVSRLDLRSGSLQRVQHLPEAILCPAVATSGNMIAICGGLSNGSPTWSCQIYSANSEKSVLPNFEEQQITLNVSLCGRQSNSSNTHRCSAFTSILCSLPRKSFE